MVSRRELLTLSGLGLIEVTPPALLLVFWGAPGAWGVLYAVVLMAALADALVQGWLPKERQKPALVVVALLLALWAVKGVVVGDYGILGAWRTMLEALFMRESEYNGLGYLMLLAALYCTWRGIGLADYEQVGLRELFGRAMGGVLVVLILGSFAKHSPESNIGTIATIELLAFVAVGLLTIALSRNEATSVRHEGWRRFGPIGGAIALVLGIALVFVSLLGYEAGRVLGALGEIVLTIIAIILAPVALILLAVFEWLFRLLNVPALFEALQQAALELQQPAAATDFIQEVNEMLPWAGPLLEWLIRLLPVLVLLAMIWMFVRFRGGRAPNQSGEERESLFSWSGLAGDLRDLLSGLRRHGEEHGLRAALARLSGDHPATRIRRMYIQLLLAGEAHQQPRTAPQTPQEYEPVAQATFPGVARPIDSLTDAYERARYHPESATPSDANAAEQAWEAIRKQSGG